MRLLTVHFLSSAEFLSHFSQKVPHGALFYRTRTALNQSEVVLMEISFAGLPSRVLARATVHSIEAGKGAWLAFDEADASSRDFLVGLARGEIHITMAAGRSHHRYPSALPVDVAIDGATEQEAPQAADLGAGGAFIRHDSPPPSGTQVEMTIGPTQDAKAQTFVVKGRVAWVRQDEGSRGFGVRFENRDEDTKRLRTLLRRASESGRIPLGKPPKE